MAEVRFLRGEKIEVDDGTHGLLTALRDLISRIEAGDIKPEKWFLLVEAARLDNPAIIRTEVFDSGLTLAEAVYLLDGAKYDIHWKARQT